MASFRNFREQRRSAKTAQYTYTFAGWNAEPAAAIKEFEYYAVYERSVNSYLIVFMNGDELLQSGKAIYGEIPGYLGEIPTQASAADSCYTFAGWIPSVVAVTGEAIYSAMFSASAIGKSSGSEKSSSGSAASSSSNGAKSSSSSEAKSGPGASVAILSGTIVPKFGMDVAGRSVQISGAKTNAPVAAFDVQGRMLKLFEAPAESFNIELPNEGSHVLRIGRDVLKISAK